MDFSRIQLGKGSRERTSVYNVIDTFLGLRSYSNRIRSLTVIDFMYILFLLFYVIYTLNKINVTFRSPLKIHYSKYEI